MRFLSSPCLPFPILGHWRKEVGDLLSYRSQVRKLSSSPYTPINYKAQATGAAGELLPGVYYRVCLCAHVSHFLRFIHSPVPLKVLFLWSWDWELSECSEQGEKDGGSGITHSGSMIRDWRVSHNTILRDKWLEETSQVNYFQPSLVYICGGQGLKERFSYDFSIYNGRYLARQCESQGQNPE